MNVLLMRLWIQATANRKRFGFLCALLAVGFLLWARIIILENIPREAVADHHGDGGSIQVPAGGQVTHRPDLPRRRVVLSSTPLRDPLEINPLYFPKTAEPIAVPIPVTPDNVQERERERRRVQLQILVSRFKLEGVMLGNPMAMISGRRFTLGSEVPALGNNEIRFTLAEINHRSILLMYEDFVFPLEMGRPPSP